jgi:hypothetical protein
VRVWLQRNPGSLAARLRLTERSESGARHITQAPEEPGRRAPTPEVHQPSGAGANGVTGWATRFARSLAAYCVAEGGA